MTLHIPWARFLLHAGQTGRTRDETACETVSTVCFDQTAYAHERMVNNCKSKKPFFDGFRFAVNPAKACVGRCVAVGHPSGERAWNRTRRAGSGERRRVWGADNYYYPPRVAGHGVRTGKTKKKKNVNGRGGRREKETEKRYENNVTSLHHPRAALFRPVRYVVVRTPAGPRAAHWFPGRAAAAAAEPNHLAPVVHARARRVFVACCLCEPGNVCRPAAAAATLIK